MYLVDTNYLAFFDNFGDYETCFILPRLFLIVLLDQKIGQLLNKLLYKMFSEIQQSNMSKYLKQPIIKLLNDGILDCCYMLNKIDSTYVLLLNKLVKMQEQTKQQENYPVVRSDSLFMFLGSNFKKTWKTKEKHIHFKSGYTKTPWMDWIFCLMWSPSCVDHKKYISRNTFIRQKMIQIVTLRIWLESDWYML